MAWWSFPPPFRNGSRCLDLDINPGRQGGKTWTNKPAGSGGDREAPRADHVLLQDVVLSVDLNQRYVIGPEIGEMLQHTPGIGLVQRGALDHHMAQHQPAVAGEIDIDHLDIGIDMTDVILPCEFAANAAIAARIVDRIDLDAFGEFAGRRANETSASFASASGDRNWLMKLSSR